MKTKEEILRGFIPRPKNEGEKNDDINILKAMQVFSDQEVSKALSDKPKGEELDKRLVGILDRFYKEDYYNEQAVKDIKNLFSSPPSVENDDKT